MVADTFDNRDRAGVAHRKALTRNTAEIALAGDGAVKNSVADNDRVFRDDTGVFRRAHDDAATRKTLADIVVAVTHQIEGDAASEKRAEGLTGRAAQRHVDRIVLQTLMAPALGKRA
ncbi:hypothetical protein D3C72_1242270 [compost metagenome]